VALVDLSHEREHLPLETYAAGPMFVEVVLITVRVMEDEPRLPLVRAFVARFSIRDWIVLDAAVALVAAAGLMTAIALAATPRLSGTGWDVARYGATGVTAGALPFRRRFPINALVMMVVASSIAVALQAPPPIVGLAALGLYSVASSTSTRFSQVTLAVVVVATAVAAWVGSKEQFVSSELATALSVVAAWLAGENTRSRRIYGNAVAQRSAEREMQREERSRRAVAEERIVIARELHDIVAHAMSVITVRAGVARLVLSEHPEEATEALGIIETTARRALEEMRLLVGVLRNVEIDEGELAPAPGLAAVGGLIDQAGHAGVKVTVEILGQTRSLSGGADLSVYRIIQEALTNVVRHAGPTSARVRIEYCADEIVVDVTDEGGRRWNPPQVDSSSGGNGLIGMRERVALYGGVLSVGPRGRGFEVRASLPMSAVEA
jgi:signal transduction histidine kinase